MSDEPKTPNSDNPTPAVPASKPKAPPEKPKLPKTKITVTMEFELSNNLLQAWADSNLPEEACTTTEDGTWYMVTKKDLALFKRSGPGMVTFVCYLDKNDRMRSMLAEAEWTPVTRKYQKK